jgi:hypothetical protein
MRHRPGVQQHVAGSAVEPDDRSSAAAGRQVTLPMPPRLTTTRLCALSNAAAWKAGTSGAPWPPAATSRERRSATTSMPVSSAMVAGAFNCSV